MKTKVSLQSIILILSLFAFSSLSAQISIPEVEAVYGGRINAISGYSKNADTSVIFITTESANSAFYAEVHTPSVGTPTFGTFQVLPTLSATAGYGSSIRLIDAVEHTGTFVFALQAPGSDGLYYTHPPYTAISPIYTSGMVSDFIVADSMVFWINGNLMFWGKFDASGVYASASAAPVTLPLGGGMIELAVHPLTGIVYIFDANTKTLVKSSDAFDAFTSGTTFTNISLSSIPSTVSWQTLGISPSGRIFIGGSGNSGGQKKWIAYSDNETTWLNFDSGVAGVNGNSFSFNGTASNYNVGYGSMYSNNNGTSGTWANFGNISFETHPNDGACFADPNNANIVYMTTDQGIGASTDKGPNIFEINDGVEAVQVQDIDMSRDKQTAWLAAKSGIRRVTNYLTSPTWTNAIFPNNDGSPYYSAEMNKEDNDTVFVGNLRVYRTKDNGSNWENVFTAENAPYNFPNVGSEVQAIEICDFSPNIVMAAYNINGTNKGGLFVSTQNGDNGTWSQILLHATTIGQDVDVFDIEFTQEGSDTVAYVGVEYDLSAPTGRSVYKVVKNGANWTASQDMTSSTTSTGSLIVATILDIEISTTGDTIFAAGTDAGVNHPICYYKPLNSTGLWTPFTVSGFPVVAGKKGKAVTIGVDTIYCAVDNEIYYYPLSGTSWSLGHAYPNGTDINVLYYDDLLAGTGTGLYEHPNDGIRSFTRKIVPPLAARQLMSLYPNPVHSFATVNFEIPKAGLATLSIVDLNGKLIEIVASDYFAAGNYVETIMANQLPKGVYLVVLRLENYMETQKLLIAR
jgi:hypothetical protein